jgi:hypothetical protein
MDSRASGIDARKRSSVTRPLQHDFSPLVATHPAMPFTESLAPTQMDIRSADPTDARRPQLVALHEHDREAPRHPFGGPPRPRRVPAPRWHPEHPRAVPDAAEHVQALVQLGCAPLGAGQILPSDAMSASSCAADVAETTSSASNGISDAAHTGPPDHSRSRSARPPRTLLRHTHRPDGTETANAPPAGASERVLSRMACQSALSIRCEKMVEGGPRRRRRQRPLPPGAARLDARDAAGQRAVELTGAPSRAPGLQGVYVAHALPARRSCPSTRDDGELLARDARRYARRDRECRRSVGRR